MRSVISCLSSSAWTRGGKGELAEVVTAVGAEEVAMDAKKEVLICLMARAASLGSTGFKGFLSRVEVKGSLTLVASASAILAASRKAASFSLFTRIKGRGGAKAVLAVGRAAAGFGGIFLAAAFLAGTGFFAGFFAALLLLLGMSSKTRSSACSLAGLHVNITLSFR